MLVRVLQGNSWAAAEPIGDFEFEQLPTTGHKIAIAGPDGWSSGQVRDIAHRIGDPDEAADVALLVGPMLFGDDRSDMLPFGQLDQLSRPTATASVPKASPWR
ncbi:hypothetical protein [Sphingomonas sp. MMS24-J13]|uniref:hypothetical protein n=1 Tax=Sphingomonas sp. MMS24-J13 TaxID=3238686 RepID=UPI00384AE8B4